MGSLTGCGTRRGPLKDAWWQDIALQFIAVRGGPSGPPNSCRLGLLADDGVERPQELFTLRVGPGLVEARGDPQLRLLGDPPVFAVRQVPELDRIVGVEVRPRELARVEVPLADDLGAI